MCIDGLEVQMNKSPNKTHFNYHPSELSSHQKNITFLHRHNMTLQFRFSIYQSENKTNLKWTSRRNMHQSINSIKECSLWLLAGSIVQYHRSLLPYDPCHQTHRRKILIRTSWCYTDIVKVSGAQPSKYQLITHQLI